MTVRSGIDMADALDGAAFVYPRNRGGAAFNAGNVTPPTVPPLVTFVTALPPVNSSTPIVITVVGMSTYPLRKAWLSVVFPTLGAAEVIWDGTKFGTYYSGGTNSVVVISSGNGLQFTLLRDGGWPQLPVQSSFIVSAVDTVGNGV